MADRANPQVVNQYLAAGEGKTEFTFIRPDKGFGKVAVTRFLYHQRGVGPLVAQVEKAAACAAALHSASAACARRTRVASFRIARVGRPLTGLAMG